MSPRYRKQDGNQIKGNIRERLLQAAADEFSRVGFDKASVDKITSSAGVATGTIYNYFDTKSDLLLKLLEEIGRDHIEYMADHIRSQPDPIGRIDQLFSAGFDFVHQHPAQARVLFNNLQGPMTPIKEHLGTIYQPLTPLIITEILQPGIEQGVFTVVPLIETATMILTFYLGIGSLVDEEGNVPFDLKDIVNFVLRALGAEKQRE